MNEYDEGLIERSALYDYRDEDDYDDRTRVEFIIDDAAIDYCLRIAIAMTPSALREWVKQAPVDLEEIAERIRDRYSDYLAKAFKDIATRQSSRLSGKQRGVIARGMALVIGESALKATQDVDQIYDDYESTAHERKRDPKDIMEEALLGMEDKARRIGG